MNDYRVTVYTPSGFQEYHVISSLSKSDFVDKCYGKLLGDESESDLFKLITADDDLICYPTFSINFIKVEKI